VRRFRFVPRDQALQQLRQSSGLADVVDSLPQNPLPDAFIVDATETTAQALESLRDEFKQWPRVAHVQLDTAWARRLDAALRLGRLMTASLALLLALALVAITFNTIRLQVLTRRDEIEVTKLIGGTDAFIRRPFLYFGALQGVVSGVLAWLLVSAAVWILNRNLIELSQAYASLLEFRHLTPGAALPLVLISGFLGWLGARLSVSRYLHSLDQL
jgi:cell division transport system permease protein